MKKKNNFTVPKKEEKKKTTKIAEIIVFVALLLFFAGSVLGTIAFFRTNKNTSAALIKASAEDISTVSFDDEYPGLTSYNVSFDMPYISGIYYGENDDIVYPTSFGSFVYNSAIDRIVSYTTAYGITSDFPDVGGYVYPIGFSFAEGSDAGAIGVYYLSATEPYNNEPDLAIRSISLSVHIVNSRTTTFNFTVQRYSFDSGRTYSSIFAFALDNDFYPFYSDIQYRSLGQDYTSDILSDSVFSQIIYTESNTDTSSDIYYQLGYTSGYDSGYSDGESFGYDNGYSTGNIDGYERGFIIGKSEGLSMSEHSFTELITSIIDVPIKAFTGLFEFDLLGVNLSSFFFALLTVCVIVTVAKLFI